MKKLEIELYRYENLVFGKVLNQDKSFRGRGIITEVNGFKILSGVAPALISKKLFIQGNDKELDNSIFCYLFEDSAEAIEVCKKIKKCVDFINGEGNSPSIIERIV